MTWKRGFIGVSGAPPPSFHRKQPPSWPMGKWTALSPDLFSDRAAEAGNMVTERHQKQPQMRGIGSNEAACRIDTRGGGRSDSGPISESNICVVLTTFDFVETNGKWGRRR